jgi:hypothetical protein
MGVILDGPLSKLMKHSLTRLTVLGFTAFAIAALPLRAADEVTKPDQATGKAKKEAPAGGQPANPSRAVPFNGRLTAKTDASITVGERTFQVDAKTKIMKDGKAATLADGVVGEPVGGQYLNQDGKLVAKSVRLGAKPEKAPKAEKPEKAEKAKPAE